MPTIPNPETAKFLRAVEAFTEKPPRDLPDGALETLTELQKSLRNYSGPTDASPGEQEAAKIRQAVGTDGTGAAYPEAAKGSDGPSPGQIEHDQLVKQAQELATSLAQVGGSGGQGN